MKLSTSAKLILILASMTCCKGRFQNSTLQNSTLAEQGPILRLKTVPRQIGVHYSCVNKDPLAAELPQTRKFVDKLALMISQHNADYFAGIYSISSICLRLSPNERTFFAKGYEGTILLGLRYLHDKSLEAQIAAFSHEFGHILGQHQSNTTHYPKLLDDLKYAQQALTMLSVSKQNARILVDFYNAKINKSTLPTDYDKALEYARSIEHKAAYILGETNSLFSPKYNLTEFEAYPDIQEIASKLKKEEWLPGALADEDASPELKSWQEDEANLIGMRLTSAIGMPALEFARHIAADIFKLDPDFKNFDECVSKIEEGIVPVWREIQRYPTPCRMVFNILEEAKGIAKASSSAAPTEAIAELRKLLIAAQAEIKLKMPAALGTRQ